MTLLSLTAFAETHGVKKQSAAEWKTKGLLVMVGDLIDLEASDANMEARAKGRFRVKAHGGRRAPGVHGATDRPGMGYVGGRQVRQTPPPAPPKPWVGWHRIGNPATFADGVRELYEIGENDDASALIDYREWEEACTFLGWDRWPAAIAAKLAAELGAVSAQAVEVALARLVRERLATLDWTPDDLADDRLKPR